MIMILSLLQQSACSSSISTAKASENQPGASPSADTAAPPASASVPPSASESPEVSKTDVPEKTAADDSYFSDAAFAGNSLVDGFRLFSGLSGCAYYAATSMTVAGASSKAAIKLDNGQMGTIVQALSQKPFGKIYILLGINEIGSNTSAFIDQYGKMLDTIIAAQPNCKIYVMSLTPVSRTKSESSDTYSMSRINEYNTALHKLAADKACYYLDLVSALAGPDGYLPADETTDGVHFAPKTYQKWCAYLKTHYV